MYSVREEAKEDPVGVLTKVAKMGYMGVEFGGTYGMSAKDLKKVLDDLGLAVPCRGVRIPDEQSVGQVLDDCAVFGCAYIMSGFGKDGFATEKACVASGQAFRRGSELLKGSPVRLCVHNHYWEFDHRFGGRTPHGIALEQAPEACVEIDTYWARTGGVDPAPVIRKFAGRVPLLHIKDGPCDAAKTMAAVGEGVMEWEPVMDAADASGVEWLIVEIDHCDGSMMEAVERSLRFLVDKGYGQMRS
jgi:sugar phosphate isomerase/epimerase